jgi:hypothetical protein
MKRLGLLLVAVGTILGVTVPSVVANQPAVRFTEDVTGDVIACETATYTIASGEIQTVIHEGAGASGNLNFTGTITPRNVVAEDEEGNLYRVRGAFWFGGAFNANTGGEVFTFTGKLQIVSKDGGGIADSVNVTFHVTAQPNNFVLKEFDFGTCEEPE